jgi:integrase
MTVRDAIDLVIQNHELTDNREARYRTPHLLRLLSLDATELSVTDLMRYAKARRDEGVTPATVNRELAVLRRGCKLLGMEYPRLWKQLRESAPREGFTSLAEIERVCAHLAPGYGDMARFCFYTGWRRGEGLNLRWSEVDFVGGEVRLLAGTTKNRERRVFPLYPQLRALLEARWYLVVGSAIGSDRHVVFHRGDGLRLKAFAWHWRRACEKAGLPKLLIHDFRRTAARNLIEAGVDRQVAMKLLGHKTESIFNRYRITTKRELTIASDKLSKLLA